MSLPYSLSEYEVVCICVKMYVGHDLLENTFPLFVNSSMFRKICFNHVDSSIHSCCVHGLIGKIYYS